MFANRRLSIRQSSVAGLRTAQLCHSKVFSGWPLVAVVENAIIVSFKAQARAVFKPLSRRAANARRSLGSTPGA